jgi:DNA-binding transcriptional MerR regulator
MSTAEGAGPSGQSVVAEYRIEDLAHRSGATVRTIRAYQDRGLLPKPERRGRANVYGSAHLTRLRQIADLLDRGYTLASIKELLAAWDAGQELGGVLGLVAEVPGRWRDERAAARISRPEEEEVAAAAAAEKDARNGPAEGAGRSVTLPLETIHAVHRLVGEENAAAFIAAATDREVRARTLDALVPAHGGFRHVSQEP